MSQHERNRYVSRPCLALQVNEMKFSGKMGWGDELCAPSCFVGAHLGERASLFGDVRAFGMSEGCLFWFFHYKLKLKVSVRLCLLFSSLLFLVNAIL